MTCIFVAGMQSQVGGGGYLRASSKMDDMTLGQILTRAWTIMSDGKELVAVAVQPVQSSTSHTSPSMLDNNSITCYKCSEPLCKKVPVSEWRGAPYAKHKVRCSRC